MIIIDRPYNVVSLCVWGLFFYPWCACVLTVAPLLTDVNVTAGFQDERRTGSSPSSQLVLNWTLPELGCGGQRVTYGIDFRVITLPTFTSQLRVDTPLCLENLPVGWSAVSCAGPLPANFSRRSSSSSSGFGFYILSLPIMERDLRSNFTIGNLSAGRLHFIQVRPDACAYGRSLRSFFHVGQYWHVCIKPGINFDG